jgi:undecaprenyl-diphosphatase
VNRIQVRLGRPLLAGSARRWAGAVVVGCVVLVAVLGVLFAHKSAADSFDNAVDSSIIGLLNGHGGLEYWLTYPGTLYPAVAASAIIVFICLLTHRRGGAVLAVAAVPVADGLDDGLLKHLVDRTYFGQLTYPSGHTTAAFAIATTIAVVFLIPPQPYGALVIRVLVATAGFCVGAVVAVAVIALQWHTFTDTLGGAAVGIGTVCALALILDLFQPRVDSGTYQQGHPDPQGTVQALPGETVTRPSAWSRLTNSPRPHRRKRLGEPVCAITRPHTGPPGLRARVARPDATRPERMGVGSRSSTGTGFSCCRRNRRPDGSAP